MPGYELIDDRERRAVAEVFDNGGVLLRHGFDAMRKQVYKVGEFEQAFARKLHVRHTLAVSSGTAAVKVALKALGIGPGDEVITQCHTFVATVEAILECGATPVITEINRTLNMDPTDLESRISPRTKAIIPVHMLGVPSQMDHILKIAGAHHIPVIEDTAQSLGGTLGGRYLGTLGTVGAFSFDHGKVLTTGEGGMVATNDETLFARARAYHDHGHEYNPALPRGEDTRRSPGFNYRMMELQGAIGLVQLGKLDQALSAQRAHKHRIKAALRECRAIRFRDIPDEKGDAGDSLVVFFETPEDAGAAAGDLKRRGIGFKNLPDALPWHFAGMWEHIFRDLEPFRGRPLAEMWKKSDRILRSAIALPIFIKMDDAKVSSMIDALQHVLGVV